LSPTAVLLSLYYFLKISLQSLSILVNANIRHRRAKAAFQKTLLLNGIPLAAAQELSQAYPNPIRDVLTLMSLGRGAPFNSRIIETDTV
jgi:hypothetical protein